MKEQNKNKINWELLARDMAGELSEQEHHDFNCQLQDDKGIEEVFSQVKELWGDSKYAQELAEINTDAAWDQVHAKTTMPSGRLRRMTRLRTVMAVAAVLVVVICGYFMYSIFSINPIQSVVVAKTQTQSVSLSDGTDVAINGGSSFKYPEVFKNDTRTVELNGEAFFNVMRDESKPFIIKTEKVQIKVLGTAFNVKAYAPDQRTIVTVSTGKVLVAVNNQESKVVLKAGESAVYNASTFKLTKQINENVNYQSWKTKEINFKENTALSEVFETIEEVYQIQIEISDSSLIQGEDFNASFKHHTLDHVLETVCHSFHLNYRKEGDVYVIF